MSVRGKIVSQGCELVRPGCSSEPNVLVLITMPSTKEGILHACNKCVAWTVAHMPGRIQEIVPLDNN